MITKPKLKIPEFTFSAHQSQIHVFYSTETEEEGRAIFKLIEKTHKNVPLFANFHDKQSRWDYDKEYHKIYCFCSFNFNCCYLSEMIKFLK